MNVPGRDLAEWSPPGQPGSSTCKAVGLSLVGVVLRGPEPGEKACGKERILTLDTCGSVTLPHSALSRPWLSQAVLESLALSDQGLVIRGSVGAGCDRKAIRWGSPSHTPW